MRQTWSSTKLIVRAVSDVRRGEVRETRSK